ncbi:beta-1,6-N-acetylglucosaminyltransferase [uncultured Duncaniella sp.]|uniref:beta-1,6-N-acetylglucosaminyltransferase n=1 Tax=uncultured Duncaniella sp. TaxID=2768039 RepID=UPI0026121DE8|nr:beta-1,6-N-acetylglucosaminyltransferase [uncultured Duncaniella sp.]
MAHNEPEVLKILVGLIDDTRNDIYIMVDKKVDISIFRDVSAQHSKLVWCKNRTNVYWGHVSQIRNELNLFKEAHQGGDYSYYHLLSGVDLPIKSQNFIHEFFSRYNGSEFISISHSNNVPAIIEQKLKYYKVLSRYYRRPSRVITGVARRIRNFSERIQNLIGYQRSYPWAEVQYGSNWVSVTQKFIDYLIFNERLILKTFKGTYCPDEVYKQTLAFYSDFVDRLSELGNMRAIDWERGKPYVWKVSDLNELMSSRAIFARKFDINSAKIIKEQFLKEKI